MVRDRRAKDSPEGVRLLLIVDHDIAHEHGGHRLAVLGDHGSAGVVVLAIFIPCRGCLGYLRSIVRLLKRAGHDSLAVVAL